IYLNGAILGMTRRDIDREFDSIVSFAGQEKFLEVPVKRYSSGMYVRLAFSVAAHLQSDILLVDEVLAVGDAEFQARCLDKLKDLAHSGRTVLVVSHHTHLLRTLCSRGLLLEGGRLVFDGSTSACLDRYGGLGDTWLQSEWRRHDAPPAPLGFAGGRTRVLGQQPDLELEVTLDLVSSGPHPRAVVHLGLATPHGPQFAHMPLQEACIDPRHAFHQVTIRVKLPPLIPGPYMVNLWVGAEGTGFDQGQGELGFLIEASPMPGRIEPHAAERGLLVPQTQVDYAGSARPI
ncbi:MAG TPA: ABC transporter ATP-binding protein, partial [Candidatus Xenobia bacterium]